jgi:hypothetical protein
LVGKACISLKRWWGWEVKTVVTEKRPKVARGIGRDFFGFQAVSDTSDWNRAAANPLTNRKDPLDCLLRITAVPIAKPLLLHEISSIYVNAKCFVLGVVAVRLIGK